MPKDARRSWPPRSERPAPPWATTTRASRRDSLRRETKSRASTPYGSTDIAKFEKAVKRLFDKDATIILSSVHRAKGLEADRVVLVEPHLLGSSKYATQEWQKTQEVNLKYVALTRAKTTLVFVEG
jgi:superfamily I DNA/RNA helicase